MFFVLRINALFHRHIGLLLFFFTLACSDGSKDFVREDEIKRYLKDEHQFEHGDGEYYLILFSGHCGSCDDRSMALIQDLKKNKGVTRMGVVLHKDFSDHANLFKDSGVNVFHDTENRLLRYGLNLDRNVILVFDGDELVYWNWLHLDSFYDVRKDLDVGSES